MHSNAFPAGTGIRDRVTGRPGFVHVKCSNGDDTYMNPDILTATTATHHGWCSLSGASVVHFSRAVCVTIDGLDASVTITDDALTLASFRALAQTQRRRGLVIATFGPVPPGHRSQRPRDRVHPARPLLEDGPWALLRMMVAGVRGVVVVRGPCKASPRRGTDGAEGPYETHRQRGTTLGRWIGMMR